VVVSHSFTIALGPGTAEPPAPWIPTSLGTIGVAVFFTVSGLLIVQSYMRGLAVFIRARVLRIYPALIVAVLFCALIVGPLFTSYRAPDYWRDSAVWWFIARNATLRSLAIQSTLPDAFPANPLKAAVNDPLWTLPYEMTMYAIVAAAGIAGLLARRWLFNLTAAVAAVPQRSWPGRAHRRGPRPHRSCGSACSFSAGPWRTSIGTWCRSTRGSRRPLPDSPAPCIGRRFS
jgi:peptidoglycan/LPS O-acetylase OafA/YrhL